MDSIACLLDGLQACGASDYLKQFIGLLVGWFAWVRIIPAVRLLARTIHYKRGAVAGYLLSVRDLVRIFLLVGLREKLFAAARLTVEWELLHPCPRPPMLIDALADTAKSPEGSGRRAQDSGPDPDAARKVHDGSCDIWRKQDVKRWKEMRRRVLSGLLSPGGARAPRFDLDTVFKVKEGAENIKHYFDTLVSEKSPAVEDRDQFLCSIQLRESFIVPLHLIAGLQDRFKEQWAPVIESFPHLSTADAAGRPIDSLRTLRRLLAFQFVCWLVWGPSIPVCTCRHWRGWKDRPVFQLGFGDENNSIPLVIDNPQAAALICQDFANSGVEIARRVAVSGALHWGPSVGGTAFCPAQRDIAESREERLVLRTEQAPLMKGGSDAETSALYYSAYIWTMFVVCDLDGHPLGGDADGERASWDWLLPFFEHGNLAELSTLRTLKRQLAEKALSEALELLDANPTVQLRYVCAVDDSCCFEDGTRKALQFPSAKGETLRELMAEARAGLDAMGSRIAARLMLESDGLFRVAENTAGSCMLPAIIGDFQRHLDAHVRCTRS